VPQFDTTAKRLVYRFKMSRNPVAVVAVEAAAKELPFKGGCATNKGSKLVGAIISGKALCPIPAPVVGNRTGRHKAQFFVAEKALARIDAVLKQYEALSPAEPKISQTPATTQTGKSQDGT